MIGGGERAPGGGEGHENKEFKDSQKAGEVVLRIARLMEKIDSPDQRTELASLIERNTRGMSAEQANIFIDALEKVYYNLGGSTASAGEGGGGSAASAGGEGGSAGGEGSGDSGSAGGEAGSAGGDGGSAGGEGGSAGGEGGSAGGEGGSADDSGSAGGDGGSAGGEGGGDSGSAGGEDGSAGGEGGSAGGEGGSAGGDGGSAGGEGGSAGGEGSGDSGSAGGEGGSAGGDGGSAGGEGGSAGGEGSGDSGSAGGEGGSAGGEGGSAGGEEGESKEKEIKDRASNILNTHGDAFRIWYEENKGESIRKLFKGKSIDDLNAIESEYKAYHKKRIDDFINKEGSAFTNWMRSEYGKGGTRKLYSMKGLDVDKVFNKYLVFRYPLVASGVVDRSFEESTNKAAEQRWAALSKDRAQRIIWRKDEYLKKSRAEIQKEIQERDRLQYKKDSKTASNEELARLRNLNRSVGEATWAGCSHDVAKFIVNNAKTASNTFEVSKDKDGKYIVKDKSGNILDSNSAEAIRAGDIYRNIETYAKMSKYIAEGKGPDGVYVGFTAEQKKNEEKLLLLAFRSSMEKAKGFNEQNIPNRDKVVIDNYEKIAIEAAKRAAHGASIDDVMRGFKVVERVVNEKKTEKHRSAIQRIKDFFSGLFGRKRAVPESAVAKAAENNGRTAAGTSTSAESGSGAENVTAGNVKALTKDTFEGMDPAQATSFMNDALNKKRAELGTSNEAKFNELKKAVETWNGLSSNVKKMILGRKDSKGLLSSRNAEAVRLLEENGLIVLG